MADNSMENLIHEEDNITFLKLGEGEYQTVIKNSSSEIGVSCFKATLHYQTGIEWV